MAQKRCLIIDKMHPSIIGMLEQVGFEVHYRPEINRQEVIDTLSQYTGIIVRSKLNIDGPVLEAGAQLRFIGRAGAGVDLIDLEIATRKGIQILNAPEGNRDAVGEHCIGMLLSLLHKINLADQQIRKGIWDREGNRGIELKGKNVAIIGYGHMGRAFAQRLSGFGCQVMAYDKYEIAYADAFAREASMQEIFEQADVVSFHIPLSDDTRNLVDSAYLKRFKKPLYMINTARGEILSLSSLVESIKSEKIIGVALDVLENEKINNLNPEQQISFDFLTQSPVTIMTPHVAGWTEESYIKINQTLLEKIQRLDIS